MANPTRTLDSWSAQNNHVERLLDNAAYTSAHPDDTLLLAGPARWEDADLSLDTDQVGSLLPIGMVQSFNISQSVPLQPVPVIGSGRRFYVRSTSSIGWGMARLWLNGRNLLRALYHNAVVAGINVRGLPEPGGASAQDSVFINLDSEVFAAPFGMLFIVRDKSNNSIMAQYIESMMIANWSCNVTAGASSIMSNVSGVADRVVPVDLTSSSIQSSLDSINSFVDAAASDAADVASA